MARPKKEFPPAKTRQLAVRFTEDEYQVLTYNANASHMARGEYIRHLINNQKITYYPPVIRDDTDILKELNNISKLGNNLNQIARYFNQNGHATDPIVEEIRSALAQIHESCAKLNLAVEAEYGSH